MRTTKILWLWWNCTTTRRAALELSTTIHCPSSEENSHSWARVWNINLLIYLTGTNRQIKNTEKILDWRWITQDIIVKLLWCSRRFEPRKHIKLTLFVNFFLSISFFNKTTMTTNKWKHVSIYLIATHFP